MSGMQW